MKAVAIREGKRDAYAKDSRKQNQSLIEPWTEELATTIFVNGIIAFRAEGATVEVARDFINKIDVSWFETLERNLQAQVA